MFETVQFDVVLPVKMGKWREMKTKKEAKNFRPESSLPPLCLTFKFYNYSISTLDTKYADGEVEC